MESWSEVARRGRRCADVAERRDGLCRYSPSLVGCGERGEMGYGAERTAGVEGFVAGSMGVKELGRTHEKNEQDAQERDDGPEVERRVPEIAKCDRGLHWVEAAKAMPQ